jgi:hypothetical protein
VIAVRHPSHVDRWLVDYSADLVAGEALDGTPTHVADDDSSPAVLVLTAEGLVGTGSPEVNTQARVRITGGKHGRTYQITSTAVTTNSRTLVHVWPYLAFSG